MNDEIFQVLNPMKNEYIILFIFNLLPKPEAYSKPSL